MLHVRVMSLSCTATYTLQTEVLFAYFISPYRHIPTVSAYLWENVETAHVTLLVSTTLCHRRKQLTSGWHCHFYGQNQSIKRRRHWGQKHRASLLKWFSSDTLRTQIPSPSSIGNVKERKLLLFQGSPNLVTTTEALRLENLATKRRRLQVNSNNLPSAHSVMSYFSAVGHLTCSYR